MRFAELCLRLGCSLTGWLVAYAHCLWLAVLPQARCGGVADDPWRATLFLAVPTFVFALLIPAARPLPGVASVLRWLSLPLLVLVPLAARSVVPALQRASIDGAPLCAALVDPGAAPAAWEGLWAPVQLLVLATIAAAGVFGWRSPSTSEQTRR